MPSDLSTAARTPQDQEFTYYAVGMVAGAIPGIVVGFIVAAFVGHAAMWLSVFGGVGIIIGLVVATVVFRRRRAAARAAQPTSPAAPGDDVADRRS
ncbi:MULTISPECIES: hypothetical protein [Kocuria]|uniref:Major facilitator superfamily (MFS) profile domain-containing protein n=1 Tax=Kocuria marina subsp. indica TaxID=1049583 RepID=A0A1X7DB87_9MICC|nr:MULTISPECIES: hypothetical protein [Kocuria]MCT1723574.1 hypothetical protein [Kocuria marina]MCT1735555.1 hypothetical protein [Kocuria marina]MCT2361314.1 hypothetical protein [Kocuria marina]OBA45334.1 hypothetical protein A5728_11720 [Kocuria sp. ICS0012]SMF12252.1 hypothetical protein SAMN06296028_11066 [Kocuria indica]